MRSSVRACVSVCVWVCTKNVYGCENYGPYCSLYRRLVVLTRLVLKCFTTSFGFHLNRILTTNLRISHIYSRSNFISLRLLRIIIQPKRDRSLLTRLKLYLALRRYTSIDSEYNSKKPTCESRYIMQTYLSAYISVEVERTWLQFETADTLGGNKPSLCGRLWSRRWLPYIGRFTIPVVK